jgi:hypothetical protein
MSFRVYISGKMSNRYVEDVKSERARTVKELARYQIHGVDPAAAESQLWPSSKKAKISSTFKRRVMEAMVQNDLWLIRRSDALIYITASIASEGSLLEVAYAKMIGLPIIIVSPERVKGQFMGWLSIYVPKDHTFSTIEEACRFINRRYKKQYERNHRYFERAIKNAAKQVNKSIKQSKKRLDK